MGTAKSGRADAALTANLPGYLRLGESGELEDRVRQACDMLARCSLCPRACGVNRLEGKVGYCRAGADPVVASWNVHHWEEPPISGTRGSGTIFFTHCTGRCIFCQNYPISQLGAGNAVSVERLAEMTVELQEKGCHNINLVTPTHFVPQIVMALPHAISSGLHIPLVYNTNGYDSLETLRLLDGLVDIYLPDAKYADDTVAHRLSGFQGYVEANRAALREIVRQVGDELILNEEGIAVRGMIVRHLVLPDGLAQSEAVLSWLAQELSPRVYISLMDQYFPAHRAVGDPILGRKITTEEYAAALDAFERAGLENGWRQEHDEECG
jgi:putative pyruvate formate lyase activating enzyme